MSDSKGHALGDFIAGVVVTGLAAIMALIFLVKLANEMGQEGIKLEAVKLGHAEYIADEQGNSVWQWKGRGE